MDATVFYLESRGDDDSALAARLKKGLNANGLFDIISPKDIVAVKTHFGESGSKGYVRPAYLKMLGDQIKTRRGKPFLTETATLYRGRRTNAVDHCHLAYEHGFTPGRTGMPIVMADGLLGDEEIDVSIAGQIYSSVKIASLIVKAQALVMVSHFTGHLASGFGATIKNLGMGCASRRGKLIQHSTSKPSIKTEKCTGCRECAQWCPQDAISFETGGSAAIDARSCIGCAECLAVCRYDAVGFDWSETYENLQRKIVEHALGVTVTKPGKALYINVLTRITKDCDCMGKFEQICPDLGILAGTDPVAVDAAALDLVEEALGSPLTDVAYSIPHRVQIEYGEEIGLGRSIYHLTAL